MSIHEYLEKMKIVQRNLISFIEDDDNVEENYQNLIIILNQNKYIENRINFKPLLHLLLQISNNHNHNLNFYSKIERILISFKTEIKQYFSGIELFEFFNSNKRILLFLINEQFIIMNEKIVKLMIDDINKYNNEGYLEYFQPEINPFLTYIKNNLSRLLILKITHLIQ